MTSAFSMLDDERPKRKRSGSTGKTAKPRLSKGSSPRLRFSGRSCGYSMKRYPARPSRPNAVVKAAYVKSNSDAHRHTIQLVDYLKDRSKKPWEERKFFDREQVDLRREDIINRLADQRGEDIAMYKLILSPGDNSVNLKVYTRETMDRLEENLGYRVDWIAIDQYNTEHYHSHVIVAGKIPEQLPTDRGKDKELEQYIDRWAQHKEGMDLRLNKSNLQAMREAGNDYISRDRSIERELDLSIQREFGIDNWTRDRELYERLKIDIWYQDRTAEDRDLHLKSSREDYEKNREIGIDNRDYDRQIAYDLGLSKTYQLGRPFENLGDVLKNDSMASKAYELTLDERNEYGTEAFRELANELQQLGERNSFDRYGKDAQRDDRSDGLADLALSLSSRSDGPERQQEYAGNGFYEPRQDDSSGHEFETFDSDMFENREREDRDDDQYSQQQPQGG